MGKAIEGVDWSLIQLAYQRGEGSTRELSIKYNVPFDAIRNRCARQGWAKELKEVGARVSQLTVETLAQRRVKLVEEIEDEAIPIARSLSRNVSLSLESMHGEPIDSAHLSGLANALKVSNHVARLNAGAVDPSTKVDVTSGGLSMHQSMLAMIEASRKMAAEGKLLQSDVDAIDVESMVKELAESKKLEGQ